MRNNKVWGHLSVLGAYTIFGFNIIICKELTNAHLVSSLGLFCFRSVGACLLFWLISLFLPKEKVPFKDLCGIFVASMLGFFLTQLSYLESSKFTTPLDTSIITSTTPIFTMFVAAIALKEPITLKKAGGVTLSFIGVILLVLNTIGVNGNGITQSKPIGILLMIGNCLFFASYLGIFRPLISKYHVVTFMKWIFLFSTIVAVPLNIKELTHLPFAEMSNSYWLQLGYIIIFATFIAYFLLPIGQKQLRPTVVSLYTYVQPLIGMVTSIILGMDRLNWQKVLAAALVFTGVILVNKSRAKGENTSLRGA
ncbi:MAG: DMT family transporter [Bacteroidales bacterium]|nr:DMT family transporter [Bacteroidales bacterium]